MLCCDQGFADGLALGCSGKDWSSCVCNASISLVQAEPRKAKLFYHSNLAADDYANCESPRDGLCRRFSSGLRCSNTQRCRSSCEQGRSAT